MVLKLDYMWLTKPISWLLMTCRCQRKSGKSLTSMGKEFNYRHYLCLMVYNDYIFSWFLNKSKITRVDITNKYHYSRIGVICLQFLVIILLISNKSKWQSFHEYYKWKNNQRYVPKAIKRIDLGGLYSVNLPSLLSFITHSEHVLLATSCRKNTCRVALLSH